MENITNLSNMAVFIVHTSEDTDSENQVWAKKYFSRIEELRSRGILPNGDSARYQIKVYQGENHTINNPHNVRDFILRTTEFFKGYLM